MKILLFSVFLFSTILNASTSIGNSVSNLFQLGESAWVIGDHSNSVKYFRQVLAINSNEVMANALLCRALFEIGELLPKNLKSDRLALYEEMIRLSTEAIAIDPQKGEPYFMRALGLARRATVKGIFDNLKYAKFMEQDWLKADSLNMTYVAPNGEMAKADVYHALALFYRECPEGSFFKWLMGTSDDLKKSIVYSRKAVELRPTQVEMVLELGVALIAKGLDDKNKSMLEEGKAIVKKVSTMPPGKKSDAIDIEHSSILLANPDLCHDYDRDDLQELLDKKKKKKS